ncbi:RNA polymerase subunit sigma [Desulfonema ishimotonii]|uniref:protein acetyllysine N-acetyltransferase n=1 Tax=Desulfonema ishimotonii TaxID=45657 RepID=A0A401G0T0_9BACT|nr:NAD-dependent deacylase [Desulfonema ishimotonii]GBC62829.1 RNA polymerase subunit sigma [Desulfonema ishimotonii]
MTDMIRRAAEDIAAAEYVVALTGAGISVESGIPPFRGKGGIWDRVDPMTFGHIDTFEESPEKVWRVLIRDLKTIIEQAEPNDGHRGLARLEAMGRLSTIITQNVDGLHQAAGNTDVIEFHGNCARQRCMDCGNRLANSAVDISALPPRCGCGGVLRPDWVFFGEAIPEDALRRSGQMAARCDMMLVVGTSAIVQPAAHMPIIAKENGATVIEINPERTPLTGHFSDYLIRGRAGAVMNGILAALEPLMAERSR